MTSRDEFVKKLKQQIDELNGEVDKLEARADSASAQARAELDKRRAQLEEQRGLAVARLTDIREAGEDNWEHLRDEAEHAMKALHNSFNYFKSHFR